MIAPITATRRHPTAMSALKIGLADATDGEHRLGRDGQRFTHQGSADGRTLRLHGGVVDGTKTQVVAVLAVCFRHLVQGMGAASEETSGADQATGHIRGQVVLTQMNAIGIHGQGQINPVVDDQQSAVITAESSQGSGFCQSLQVAAGLYSGAEPWPHRCAEQLSRDRPGQGMGW